MDLSTGDLRIFSRRSRSAVYGHRPSDMKLFGPLVVLLALSTAMLLAGCSGGSTAPTTRPTSSSPAPLSVDASQTLFKRLINVCETRGRAFDTALESHHNVFGPDFANERAAAAHYARSCSRTVNAFLHDQWPIDPLAFHLTATDLRKTVRLMASFALGDIPGDWLHKLNAAKHKVGRDLGLLEADIGLL